MLFSAPFRARHPPEIILRHGRRPASLPWLATQSLPQSE